MNDFLAQMLGGMNSQWGQAPPGVATDMQNFMAMLPQALMALAGPEYQKSMAPLAEAYKGFMMSQVGNAMNPRGAEGIKAGEVFTEREEIPQGVAPAPKGVAQAAGQAPVAPLQFAQTPAPVTMDTGASSTSQLSTTTPSARGMAEDFNLDQMLSLLAGDSNLTGIKLPNGIELKASAGGGVGAGIGGGGAGQTSPVPFGQPRKGGSQYPIIEQYLWDAM